MVTPQTDLAPAGAPEGDHHLGQLIGDVHVLLARPTQTRLAAQAHTVVVQQRGLLA